MVQLKSAMVALGLCCGSGLVGCSGRVLDRLTLFEDQGAIEISADAEGMRAFGDLITGSINTAKTPDGAEPAHYVYARERVTAKYGGRRQSRYERTVNAGPRPGEGS